VAVFVTLLGAIVAVGGIVFFIKGMGGNGPNEISLLGFTYRGNAPSLVIVVIGAALIALGLRSLDRLPELPALRQAPAIQAPANISPHKPLSEGTPSEVESPSPASASPSNVDGTTAIFAPPAHSIAVLAFVNMSGDAQQDYFSDGFAEELLIALTQFSDLQVEARTSSFYFKGQNVDISLIARKLNVANILEGSVRRSGNKVRITVKLINAITGKLIWSQSYDRTMNDIFKVQTNVATAVAQQLEVKLIGDEADKIQAGGTDNPLAYDDYLQGKELLDSADSEEAFRAALAEFDQAIAIDPHYAAAFTGRANTLSNLIFVTSDLAARQRNLDQAIDAAKQAIALGPTLGEPHQILAVIYCNELQFSEAEREGDQALALSPGSAKVQRNVGFFLAELGRFQQSLTAARRAVTLDPSNFWSHYILGRVLYLARRYSDAELSFRTADTIKPGSHQIGVWRTFGLLASRRFTEAQQLCESDAAPLDDGNRHGCLVLLYHALGRQADAEREFQRLKALAGEAAAYSYADIYAQWGQVTEALQWLSTAERLRDPDLQLLKVDWLLDPIRNEPQFKVIETRMNFPP
jgi:TolB-like protein